jgi:hypothetical protein
MAEENGHVSAVSSTHINIPIDFDSALSPASIYPPYACFMHDKLSLPRRIDHPGAIGGASHVRNPIFAHACYMEIKRRSV